MGRLRYLTAGESHGRALVGILEGLPAGLFVSIKDLEHELARRRLGYGRGPRMKIEGDVCSILAGLRAGETLGSPVAVMVENSEWAKWAHVMDPEGESGGRRLTTPRPGHADLVGMLKYDRTDARDILERASARETAIRVALATFAKALLGAMGVSVMSYVRQIGAVEAGPFEVAAGDEESIDSSPVRCPDPAASEQMVAEIGRAASEGDSLGGVVEVVAFGLFPGLGSHVHWDRKLDGRLAAALMSVPAIKGVEIGNAFDVAGGRGSVAHDEILLGLKRASNRAGGTEAGISTGEPLILRAAMKPLSTLKKRMRTVDLSTGEEAPAFQERTDVCAVPAAAVVCEAVVALVLADAVMEMFGGDTLDDVVASVERYRERIVHRGDGA